MYVAKFSGCEGGGHSLPELHSECGRADGQELAEGGVQDGKVVEVDMIGRFGSWRPPCLSSTA